MVTNEDGLRYAKLVHVSVDNGLTAQSNKVYIMTEESNGKIKCEYGRVGKNLTVVYKQSYEWDKIYKQKTSSRKGYTDITDMVTEVETVNTNKKTSAADIKNATVRDVFNDLMMFANKSIQRNYKVTQDSVTQKQIDSAQDVLDRAINLVKVGMDVKELNDLLIELYTIIPRKMDDVRNFLIDTSDSTADITFIKNFLSDEQDTLDTMAGQVKLLSQQKDALGEADEIGEVDADEMTILDQMGLIAEVETNSDSIALVKKLLGPNVNRMKRIIKVINKKTQKTFDEHLKKAKNKKRRLYWHGSRNENWFNIIQTGLLIRPSGAIHTGSMFGDGIYFADKSQKSLGYSSLSGSYWTGGTSNKGYLALFDVHLGEQKHIQRHDSSCYSLSQKVMDNEGYDSVFAHGGIDLRNNEFIIYNSAKCTIAYLIEME